MAQKDNITIKYPSVHTGAQRTSLRFFNGEIDLLAVLHPGKSAGLAAPAEEGTLFPLEGDAPQAGGLSRSGKSTASKKDTDKGRRFFVTDATVATLPCVKAFIDAFDDGECADDRLLIMGSGEAYKTIDSVLGIIKEALKAGFTRKDTFVGIGGGVICDLTAFAASLFKRGARFEAVPTTLLAMVDASIGGKTGCDFDTYKNMIGTFFPAAALYVWPNFVQFLPDDQYRSGLAECLKTALLYDRELYTLLTGNVQGALGRDQSMINTMIYRCAAAKSSVVESDFLERGERMFLNYGHTFGHALETVVGLGIIPHGDAVAWGMGRAACLAHNAGVCTAAYKTELLSVLEAFGWETNAEPRITSGGFAERMLKAMHKDKKNTTNRVRVILQRDICSTLSMDVEDNAIMAVLK